MYQGHRVEYSNLHQYMSIKSEFLPMSRSYNYNICDRSPNRIVC
jgi:hypothetical protein